VFMPVGTQATVKALSSADLEALGAPHAEFAAAAVGRLDRLLQALNQAWWAEGFAQGMRDLGIGSFRELRAWRDETAARWPLASDRPVKLLAWPRWDDDGELAALLRIAADPRLGAAAPCLCLRHDAASDGPAELATRRLVAVSERELRAGEEVSALIVGEPIRPEEWPRLGSAVTAALLLDSSESPERARFFARAGAPGVRGVEDLLAFLPEPPLPRVSGRVWAELSV